MWAYRVNGCVAIAIAEIDFSLLFFYNVEYLSSIEFSINLLEQICGFVFLSSIAN